MKIAAALCWYDEPEESLARCVGSLAGVTDVLVAFDGAWDGFPGATAQSPATQRAAVEEAAKENGIRVVDTAAQVWPSQVDKRSALYAAAAAAGDWVLVIDADEWIGASEPAALRLELADTPSFVAQVGLRHHDGAGRPPGAARRLFCTMEGLTVARAHNGVRTLEGRWLAGDHAYVTLEEPENVTTLLVVEHSNGTDRPHERQLADNVYRQHRREHHLERWTR